MDRAKKLKEIIYLPPFEDEEEKYKAINDIENKKSLDPLFELQKKELRDLLTKSLIRTEKLIIVLYYFEEMTQKEIGAVLDLSESRVSQLHSSILSRLKSKLTENNRKSKELMEELVCS